MGETFSVYLDQITQDIIDAAPAACFKAMTHVHGVAVNRTPLQDGNLRGESFVKATPQGADIVYPGPYARYQHFEYLRHERGGERLYLATAVMQEAQTAVAILGAELRKVIE